MDQYLGQLGKERIELLEKLAHYVARWIQQEDTTHYSGGMCQTSDALERDNDRVARVLKALD